jgi:hypothetical protein
VNLDNNRSTKLGTLNCSAHAWTVRTADRPASGPDRPPAQNGAQHMVSTCWYPNPTVCCFVPSGFINILNIVAVFLRKRMQLVVNQFYVVVNRTNIDIITNETKALWSMCKKRMDNCICKYSFADHGFEGVWVWLMGPSSTPVQYICTWWYRNLIATYVRRIEFNHPEPKSLLLVHCHVSV